MAYRLTVKAERGPRGMRRQYKAARDAGLEAAAEYWTDHLLGRHFESSATSRYRYAKRTPAHERRKRREGKSANPNVYTGRLMSKMMGMKPKVKYTSRGVELIWRGLPRYTYVVDTIEWVTKDKRWDDEFLKSLQERGEHKAAAGILDWRRKHPQTKDGRFKLVKRPDKPRELTAMNREDADAVAGAYRSVFLAKLKEATA